MDPDLKKYADTLYQGARLESADALRDARVNLAQRRALTNPNLPLSGPDLKALLSLFDKHIERCMLGRFESYYQAYAEAHRTPSEQDFTDILNDCKQVRILEIGHSAKALNDFVASHNPVPFVPTEAMVEQGSAHGHDRVLQRWNVWKAKTQLKPSSAKAAEERQKQLDVLLPIYSKAEFELDRVRITGESSEERPCSLLFLDLDKFKSINDNLGHPAGDHVLRVCADTLLRVCSGKGTVYRNGGDEFCVLLPNHSLDEALAVANRILREARAMRTEELPNGLSTSIGAACFPESASDHSELLSRADNAMYVSKEAGGNQVSKADSANRKNSEVETPKVEKKAEVGAPDKRITEPARDPYTEELKRIANQVIHYEMTLEGRHVLRHLMIHEPVEVGRTLVPEIPQDRTYAQVAIAKERGLVQHREEGRGLLRTYWIINPKFRDALQDVLYQAGTN